MMTEPLSFGPFEIDLSTRELYRDGVVVPIEPLPMRVLLRLASTPGELVTRKTLVDLGWPGRLPSVAEQSLNTSIYEIRRALAASGPSGVELETLRGRGYRLSVQPSSAEPTVGHRGPRKAARPIRALSGVLALLALAVWIGIAAAGPRSLPLEARRVLERARYLAEETGDMAAARAVLDSGRARLPEIAELHAEWADLGLLLGDDDGAARAAARALELDPNMAAAHRARAGLAMLRGDWPDAGAEMMRAKDLDPDDTRTDVALAFLRTIEGRVAEAERLIELAIDRDPLSAIVHQDAGYLFLLMGRFEEADRACRQTLRFRPDSHWALDCLFDVGLLTGRTDRAAIWGRLLLESADARQPGVDAADSAVCAAARASRIRRWTAAVADGAYPYGLAVALAADGRAKEAMDALLDAVERPRLGLLTVAVDPRLAVLRDLPEFADLVGRLGLPDIHPEERSAG